MNSESLCPPASSDSFESECAEKDDSKSSLPACEPSKPEDPRPTDLPSGKPCESGDTPTPPAKEQKRDHSVGHWRDDELGLILFRARLVLEGRYEAWNKLADDYYKNNPLAKKHWREAAKMAYCQMGYVSYEQEVELAKGLRKSLPLGFKTPEELESESTKTALDVKADLQEAYNAAHTEGRTFEQFTRPGAKVWYDLKTADIKAATALFAKYLLAPLAKAQDEEAGEVDEKTPKDREEIERMIREATA